MQRDEESFELFWKDVCVMIFIVMRVGIKVSFIHLKCLKRAPNLRLLQPSWHLTAYKRL